jgi:tripartite-type tricarboxylate transporter receptor subunit TctC
MNAMPEIPAFAEVLPGYETYGWQAVLGPKGLQREIVMRWSRELNVMLDLPEFRERLARDSMEPVGGSPERFLDVLRSDIAKWRDGITIGP